MIESTLATRKYTKRRQAAPQSSKRRQTSILFFLIAVAVIPNLAQARIGFFGKSRRKIDSHFHHDQLRGDRGSSSSIGIYVDPYGQPIITTTTTSIQDDDESHSRYQIDSTTTTSTTTRKKPRWSSPSQPPKSSSSSAAALRTDVGVLADHFQQALVAVNQKEEDIHIGKLLSACEQLETSMRQTGFTQSANDIAGNVSKIRKVYQNIHPSQRDSMPAILRYELESGIHAVKGPSSSASSNNNSNNRKLKLKEQSAAMGLLWLGRSINYQYDMFEHMLDDCQNPLQAAQQAYDDDLKPHLSWPLQKLGKAAMSTTLKSLQRDTMMARIGGFEEEGYGRDQDDATQRDLRQVMASWKPMIQKWRQVFNELELGDI